MGMYKVYFTKPLDIETDTSRFCKNKNQHC
jgi:hypothetical protein